MVLATKSVLSYAAELKRLLEIPIIPRSVSMTYPTQDEKHTLLNSITGIYTCHVLYIATNYWL